jgi:hypothetical protein
MLRLIQKGLDMKKIYYITFGKTSIDFVVKHKNKTVCRFRGKFANKKKAESALRIYKRMVKEKYHGLLAIGWIWENEENELPPVDELHKIDESHDVLTRQTKLEIEYHRQY